MPPSYQWFEFSELYDCYLANKNTKYVEYQEYGISSKLNRIILNQLKIIVSTES